LGDVNFIIVSSNLALLDFFGVGVRVLTSLVETAFFGEVASFSISRTALARERVLGPGKDCFELTAMFLYNLVKVQDY